MVGRVSCLSRRKKEKSGTRRRWTREEEMRSDGRGVEGTTRAWDTGGTFNFVPSQRREAGELGEGVKPWREDVGMGERDTKRGRERGGGKSHLLPNPHRPETAREPILRHGDL